MSLLRQAGICLANQKLYAGLNAFITPLEASERWLDRVKDADFRQLKGTFSGSKLEILYIDAGQRFRNRPLMAE